MALYKEIRQDDGVVTNYHRILYLMTTTNRQNSIAVVSYANDEARQGEIDGSIGQPYQRAVTYETDYDETMNIESAYAFLKTLPVFEGAIDV